MTKRVIGHEIKLEKSVKIILAALAFGVLANAFVPAFSVKSALAEIVSGKLAVYLSGKVDLGGNLGLGGAVRCHGCVPSTTQQRRQSGKEKGKRGKRY